jgi:hypothetical protein
MADRAELYIPVNVTDDGESFTATVNFVDQSSESASAPSTVHYRIDCLTNAAKVLDWTSVTAADSVAIQIASAYNAIRTAANQFERKQITVMGDRGLTTQCSDLKQWLVHNRNEGS